MKKNRYNVKISDNPSSLPYVINISFDIKGKSFTRKAFFDFLDDRVGYVIKVPFLKDAPELTPQIKEEIETAIEKKYDITEHTNPITGETGLVVVWSTIIKHESREQYE